MLDVILKNMYHICIHKSVPMAVLNSYEGVASEMSLYKDMFLVLFHFIHGKGHVYESVG